jgi:trans-aconitate 2-methyltransferase
MAVASTYTYGDSELASERLRWLSLAYEPAMRELVGRFGKERPSHAIDLGSGPGHTTLLLHRLLTSERTTGIDTSARFVAEARRNAAPGLSFVEHDVTKPPFPVDPADVVYCRHPLAHGMSIHVGGTLDAAVAGTPWTVEHSAVRALTLDARSMAKIHVMNLRTWRNDAAARELFDPNELDELDRRLSSIETGETPAAPVRNGLLELVVRL